jgi:glycosyltransferase involved in cell wall biosynthesis
MRRRLWIDQVHVPVTLSRFGLSILLKGLASGDNATIKDLSVTLKQGEVALSPASLSVRKNLLVPTLAVRSLGRFAANLQNGIVIAATFSSDDRLEQGLASIEAEVYWTDGFMERMRLATVSLQRVTPLSFNPPIGPDTVGIALATYNPNPSLFRSQINSIKLQSHTNWVCVVSDDCSAPGFLIEIQETLEKDPRFALSIAPTNVGFYRNFERAIALLPERCRWIACADQDDEWAPAKLELLMRQAKRTGSPLIFSDVALYSDAGQRLANTFWVHRRLEVQSPTAIALANSVTGMATLFRSCLLPTVMPFPALPGHAYHDRWIALAALAQRELQYLSQPLVRYVQHIGNDTGVLKRPAGATVLMFRFLKCFVGLGISVLRPSLWSTIPARLELIAHWTSGELLSLSLQIEALQRRLPRNRWRHEVWQQFQNLAVHPASIIFHVPLRTLADPYRRHMAAGFALSTLAELLISLGIRAKLFLRTLRHSTTVS